jgi:hypothetical protein
MNLSDRILVANNAIVSTDNAIASTNNAIVSADNAIASTNNAIVSTNDAIAWTNNAIASACNVNTTLKLWKASQMLTCISLAQSN